MINQREKQVTYGSAFSDYFRGFVDFTGYSTRAGHWFPFGTIYGAVILIFIIFFGSVLSSIIGIGNRASSSYYYTTRSAGYDLLSTASNALIFLVIFYIILFILAIPTTASFARRLRDVGFAAWGIVLAVVIFYLLNIFSIYIVTPLYDICFIFVLMSLPSNCLETDNTMVNLIIMDKRSIKVKMVVNLINMVNKITKMDNNSLTKTNKVIMDIKTNKIQISKEIMDTKVIIIKIKDILNLINMEIQLIRISKDNKIKV